MYDVCIGPHISECTISTGVRALYDFLTRKVSLCCLPKINPSQTLSGQWKSFHHILCVQQLHPTKIQMSKSKMPQPGFILNFCLKCSFKLALQFSLLSRISTVSSLSALNAAPVFVFHFMLGTILNGNKRLLVIGTFAIRWSLGCFNHTVIIFHVESVEDFCINCPMLKKLCFRPST